MTINREHLKGLCHALDEIDGIASGEVTATLNRLIAQAQAATEAEPVAEVSQETFSSDGTSDIITCNLPIGTKLYTAPQHDAELVELIKELIDVDDGGLDDHWREHAGKELMTRIDAKLATLKVKP